MSYIGFTWKTSKKKKQPKAFKGYCLKVNVSFYFTDQEILSNSFTKDTKPIALCPYIQKSIREASHDLMRTSARNMWCFRGTDYLSSNSDISHTWLQQWKATAVLRQPEYQFYVTMWFKRKTELNNALSKHRHDSSYCSRWIKDKARAERTLSTSLTEKTQNSRSSWEEWWQRWGELLWCHQGERLKQQ